jgi:hypothetical protein
MSEELRKAAERVRAYKAAVESARTFGTFPAPVVKAREVSRAETLLADAYLAEHPADDAEPVTPERLAALAGWERVGRSRWETDPDSGEYRASVSQFAGDPGKWLFTGTRPEPATNISYAIVRTLGDLRRVCRVLAIELREDSK